MVIRTPTAPPPQSGRLPEAVADSFTHLFRRVAPHFGRREVRQHAQDYLWGLLGDLPRKNGARLAVNAGLTSPDGLQRLLTTAVWGTDAVQGEVRDYLLRRLNEPDGVLVVGEGGFTKRGDRSAGVAEQFNPCTGRIENCQVAMFLSYASDLGSALVDRMLFLPRPWADDPVRRQLAGVPADVGFATKAELTAMMLDRVVRAGAPFRWLVGGHGEHARSLKDYCEKRGIGYVLQVDRTEEQPGVGAIEEVIRLIPPDAFRRRIHGDVPSGLQSDWAVVETGPGAPGFRRMLLVGRTVRAPSEVVLFDCHAPDGTSLGHLVRAADQRFATLECLLDARNRAGLDDYEVRKYGAWHRHVTLTLLVAGLLRISAPNQALPSVRAPATLSRSGCS
ncbi:IS701 family transposase [Micromonospora arida]|nr:IS701 family transposase [Micromonospora arida]